MIDWALRWANCKVAHSRFSQVMHMRVAYFQTHELVLKRAKVLSHIMCMALRGALTRWCSWTIQLRCQT